MWSYRNQAKGVLLTSTRRLKTTQKAKIETPMKWIFSNSISVWGVLIWCLWFLLRREEAYQIACDDWIQTEWQIMTCFCLQSSGRHCSNPGAWRSWVLKVNLVVLCFNDFAKRILFACGLTFEKSGMFHFSLWVYYFCW